MRERTGIFLGYLTGTKGYEIYDIGNKRMVVSRYVCFFKDIFPFKRMNNDPN